MDVILAVARYWHQDYERRRPSLTPLPLSNIVRFPAVGRPPLAAATEDPKAEKQNESKWLAGVMRRWISL